MKRIITLILCAVIIIGSMPAKQAYAAKMNPGVPVWNQESVEQYMLDYIEGISMERLYNYFDLQIRRYMPESTYEGLLIDWYPLTGNFVCFGSYRNFEETENQLKTHVLHLCMEKQDLDVYFTHKDQKDDWEIMALEFVPVNKENAEKTDRPLLDEIVVIGKEPYQLEGTLTLPADASDSNKVPACILVHDFGPQDRNATQGKTVFFQDIATLFGEMNIATLRYDKRTYTYPDAPIESVMQEVVEDALYAVEFLKNDNRIDQDRIVVLGLGLGAVVAPKIAKMSDGQVNAMILVGGTTHSIVDLDYQKNKSDVEKLPAEEAETIKNAVRKMHSWKEEKAREVELFGRNGYYYWELARYDQRSTIKSLKIPTFVCQGRNDPLVSEEEGITAYKKMGYNSQLYTYKTFRGLNHILMNDLTKDINGQPEYAVETHLDLYAGRTLAAWILNLK